MPEYLVGPAEEVECFLDEARIINASSALEAEGLYVRHISIKSDDFLEHVYSSAEFSDIPAILDAKDDIQIDSPAFSLRAFEYFERDEQMSSTYVAYLRKAVETGIFISAARHREEPIFNDEMLIILCEKSNREAVAARELASIPSLRVD